MNSLDDILKLAATYGIAAVLCILGAWGIWRLVNRLLDESFRRDERIFSEASKRDERIAEILDNSLKSLSSSVESLSKVIMAHDQRAQEAISAMREADRYQREEHQEMIRVLSEISIRLKSNNGGS